MFGRMGKQIGRMRHGYQKAFEVRRCPISREELCVALDMVRRSVQPAARTKLITVASTRIHSQIRTEHCQGLPEEFACPWISGTTLANITWLICLAASMQREGSHFKLAETTIMRKTGDRDSISIYSTAMALQSLLATLAQGPMKVHISTLAFRAMWQFAGL